MDQFDLREYKEKKIAWGICGASHLLLESTEFLEQLITKGYSVDIFFSNAGKEVSKMFGSLKKFQDLKENHKERLNLIYEENQRYSFPICGKFSQKYYSILIISPTTANTVAKLSYKIADTLITNIVSQSLKGNTEVIIIPTDFKVGPCETIIPGGKKIKIQIHPSDVERTQTLQKMKGITIIDNPMKFQI